MRDRFRAVGLAAFLARREGIVIIGAIVLLLAAVGFVAIWGTAWLPRAVLRADGDTWPLAFTPDGTKFATAGASGVTLWDAATGQARAFWTQPDGSHSGLGAFSADGQTFATVDFFGPGSPMAITLRSATDGRVQWALPMRNEGAYAILFRETAKEVRAIVGVRNSNSGEVVDIDAASGREIARRNFTLAGRTGGSAISSDGRLMAFLSGTSVILWNVETDREHAAPVTRSAGATVSSAGFSPDGSTLAVGLSNGSIDVWDLRAVKHRATIGCHTRGVRSVALQLSRDGRTVASWGRFSGADSLLGAILDSVGRAIGAGASARHEVVAVDGVSGERLGIVSAASHPFVSPAGRVLAIRDSSLAVKLFDLPARRLAGPPLPRRSIARSPTP
jgi:WD40 repeat protein